MKTSRPAPAAASLPEFYTPTWKGSIEGYVVNYATRELWRVQSTMERDDVIQEAFLVFMRCADKYPQLDTPQHFMALFKTAWARHFIDLANADTKRRAHMHPLSMRQDEDGNQMRIDEPAGELENMGVLATLVRQAPAEVKLVLRLLLSAPAELLEMALAGWQADSSDGSAHINRLVGLPASFDSVGAVRAHFSN